MPLYIPDCDPGDSGMWFEAVEEYAQRLSDKIGDETAEVGSPSLWGQMLAIRDAAAEWEKQEYWTGNAATACSIGLERLLLKTAESVMELGTAVTELEKYIELYHYVDNRAQALADAAAAEAAKL